tara:strand:+ start:42 stop:227 length:186 start_codon:yes stop_codon:yes gene_type:complete
VCLISLEAQASGLSGQIEEHLAVGVKTTRRGKGTGNRENKSKILVEIWAKTDKSATCPHLD